MSHTYVTLAVSKAAFDEISAKLTLAGYEQAFHHDAVGTPVIDMHGIGLVQLKPAEPNHVLNSDSAQLQQLEGHWQRVAALLLWKLAGRKKVRITHADIEHLHPAFGEAGPVVYTHGHSDSMDFQLIDHAAAQRLAEHEKTQRGHA